MAFVLDLPNNIDSLHISSTDESASNQGTADNTILNNIQYSTYLGAANRWTASVPFELSNNRMSQSDFTTGGASNSFGVTEYIDNLMVNHSIGKTETTNSFGAAEYATDPMVQQLEINTIIGFRKDDVYLYKFRGFNENTQQYEDWIATRVTTPEFDEFVPLDNQYPKLVIEKAEIVLERGRPNGFKFAVTVPTSGNILTNIAVVGSWIIDNPEE